MCVKQTETSPRRFIVLCVTAPFIEFGVRRYSLYKRVRQGAEKERKIRVRIISTGTEKREYEDNKDWMEKGKLHKDTHTR